MIEQINLHKNKWILKEWVGERKYKLLLILLKSAGFDVQHEIEFTNHYPPADWPFLTSVSRLRVSAYNKIKDPLRLALVPLSYKELINSIQYTIKQNGKAKNKENIST